MNNEFDIIKKYFTFSDSREDVLIVGGDDCASVSVPQDKQLLITTDTLISGVHFPVATLPEDIAYKAVMANLSDLAAMGATPAWLTLAITLPEVDEEWLRKFSTSLSALLKRFNISLIGGDTTKGALSITIQAMGLCAKDNVLRRNQAKPGDSIYVTGEIGAAAIGLKVLSESLDDTELQSCITKLNRPEARVLFAEELTAFSKCAIDISDGLVADLGHIAEASGCGAKIYLSDIPVSSASHYYFEKYNNGEIDWSLLLTQGDDYELCFTVTEEDKVSVKDLAHKHELKISCIGEITDNKALSFYDVNDKLVIFSGAGFNHFS